MSCLPSNKKPEWDYILWCTDASHVQLKVHIGILFILLLVFVTLLVIYVIHKIKVNKKIRADNLANSNNQGLQLIEDFLSDFKNRLNNKFGTTSIENGEILEQIDPISLNMIKGGQKHSVVAYRYPPEEGWCNYHDIGIFNSQGFDHIKRSFKEVGWRVGGMRTRYEIVVEYLHEDGKLCYWRMFPQDGKNMPTACLVDSLDLGLSPESVSLYNRHLS